MFVHTVLEFSKRLSEGFYMFFVDATFSDRIFLGRIFSIQHTTILKAFEGLEWSRKARQNCRKNLVRFSSNQTSCRRVMTKELK